MEPFLTKALALPSANHDTKQDTLLDALSDWTQDRKIIRDELTSVLFAGSDTTASSMTWIFFELARNPRVVRKLRNIILERIGSTRPPTYQEVKDFKYLQHIINETQRLYATMPFATRQALQDTVLPRGGGPDGLDPVGVRAGTPVIYSALVMHRRRDLYPSESESLPDPLLWVPERWENWNPKSWQLIPFSGGPRICIGQNFAVMEMGYTLVRVLQTFDRIVDYTGGGPPVLKCGIVVTPFHPVKVGFLKPGETLNWK
jgi:cytochrome P450